MNPYLKIFLKVFSVTVAAGLFLSILIMLGSVLGFFGNMDNLDLEAIINNSSSQVIYVDSQGNEQVITTLSAKQNRVWVDFADIPQDMKDAFVSIEDERFYSHHGFDIKRTSKAFFMFVANKFTGRRTTFGGSTITQQLVKNITRDDKRTAARKIQEISRAVNLEKQISKDEILELYLNSIYLSQGCNGVQTASLKFFGKPVSELNLAECASIAGITQYPSLYDPLINPEKNKEKQEIVLGKMLELGHITQEEYDEAMAYKLVFTELDPSTLSTGTIHSYFVDQVVFDVLEDLKGLGYSDIIAQKMLYSGGLKIVTTIDPTVQSAMQNVFENTDNFPNYNPDNPIQAAMVVLDPYTGAVKGIIGGVGKKTGNLVLNRATQAVRQPGSSIKPISVYGPAVENGIITPADMYADKPITYIGGDGKSWTPRNYDNTYTMGNVSVRRAIQKSLNTIAVQVLDRLGTNTSYNFLTKKLGITSLVNDDQGYAQLALGGLTNGISVLEMTAAYTPFVNRGIYSKPYTYVSVTDSDDNEILSNRPTQNIAMSEESAYVMSRMLKEVVTSGTGGPAQLSSGMYTAGKTGTSSDYYDRWFVGYTPHYVAAVWHGYDTQKSVPSAYSSPLIWNKVMTEIHKGKEVITNITTPAGVRYVSYCSETGLLPGEFCGDAVTGYWFVSGNVPTKICESKHLPEGAEEPPEEESVEEIDLSESDENTEELPAETEEPAA